MTANGIVVKATQLTLLSAHRHSSCVGIDDAS